MTDPAIISNSEAKPADLRREPPKIVGGPGAASIFAGSASGHRRRYGDGRKPQWPTREGESPWCLVPRTRHEGPWPAGVHGGVGLRPRGKPATRQGGKVKELTLKALHGLAP